MGCLECDKSKFMHTSYSLFISIKNQNHSKEGVVLIFILFTATNGTAHYTFCIKM